jgi:hypothetical protein
MQDKTKILVLLAILVGGLVSLMTSSQPASASHLSEGVWAHAVNACAIDEANLSDYAVGLGLSHKAGIVGRLTARCNVENLPISPPGDAIGLLLTYRDQDGPGSASRVIARLMQLSNSGTVSLLATVDSNTGPASASLQSKFQTFSHDFDFNNNAYYVEVTIIRRDNTQVPIAAIVRITGTLL